MTCQHRPGSGRPCLPGGGGGGDARGLGGGQGAV